MRIAVAGAGLAGAYLTALLKEEGFRQVELFDVRKNTRCGKRPCAWGFAPSSEYRRLLSRFLDPSHYIKHYSDSITIDGVKFRADMVTADKPSIINDLIGETEIHYTPLDPTQYDRVIDATGVNRAFLGPLGPDDLIATCVQHRIRSEENLGLWFKTTTVGYEYCFPLGNSEYHVGKGSLTTDFSSYTPLGRQDIPTVCKCSSSVRLTSPHYSQPFVVQSKIVGIGESIGAVASLGADGNMYAMQSAEVLVDHWDNLSAYSEEILKRFDWMRRERLALAKLGKGNMVSIRDVLTFIHHSRLAGFGINPVQALRFFRNSLEQK